MTEKLSSVAVLLDLAASTEDDSIRRRAVDRLTVEDPRDSARAADGIRGTTAAVERLLERLRTAGVPSRPRPLDPDAVALGRMLIQLDVASLDRATEDLGTIGAVVLVRARGRADAARILRSLEGSKTRLTDLANLAPDLPPDGTDSVTSHFDVLLTLGLAGDTLTRALGRFLLASLLAGAEPDVVAAIGQLVPLVDAPESRLAAEWYAAAAGLVMRRAAERS